MDSLDLALLQSLALHFLYNVGIGLAVLSIGLFTLVALARAAAFMKWRKYVDAGRAR